MTLSIKKIAINEQVKALLKDASLPIDDLQGQDNITFIGLHIDNKLKGVIGIEHFDNKVALIRSLAVNKQVQAKGYGEKLVTAAEEWAHNNGINNLFLLTTTADKFFEKHGYKVIDRTKAPSVIQNSRQMTSVCPSSATIMNKQSERF